MVAVIFKKLRNLEKSRTGRFAQKLVSNTAALAMKQVLSSADLRTAYYDSTTDPSRADYFEHCIFVFWHENQAILLPRWTFSPVTLLISQHRDAHWLKQAAHFLGFNVVRGSSTRGGASAIRKLKQQSRLTSLAITPDGPQGPRREMAMGPIFLASRLQMPLVCVGVGYDRPWRLGTWDRFAIPKPFSKARIVMGPKIYFPKKLKRDELELGRSKAQSLLRDLNQFAESWVASDVRVKQEIPFTRIRRLRVLEFDKDRTAGPPESPRVVPFRAAG